MEPRSDHVVIEGATTQRPARLRCKNCGAELLMSESFVPATKLIDLVGGFTSEHVGCREPKRQLADEYRQRGRAATGGGPNCADSLDAALVLAVEDLINARGRRKGL